MDGQNDSNTLRKDTYFLKTEKKNFRFQKYPGTCGGGLKVAKASLAMVYRTFQGPIKTTISVYSTIFAL